MNAISTLNTMIIADAVQRHAADVQKRAGASLNRTKRPAGKGKISGEPFIFWQSFFRFIDPFVSYAPNGDEMIVDWGP